MDIKEFLDGAQKLSSSKLEERLYKFVRSNYRYQNLNAQNRKLLLEILKKYLSYMRRGIGISGEMIRREMARLKKDRTKLDLSAPDLRDIQNILEELKK